MLRSFVSELLRVMLFRVIVSAVLSAVHLLALALGLGAVYARGRALTSRLDDRTWPALLAADTAWGVAAGLWTFSGLARVFLGDKTPAFYWHNGFFWLKMGLFGFVFVLELGPMMTFIRVRSARRHGVPPPSFDVRRYRVINSIEASVVVLIVFVAACMARGVWLF